MQLEEIKKLATLARIDMSEEEMKEIAHDFDSILAYVGQVQEVAGKIAAEQVHTLTNVMRSDTVTNTPGEYTEKIIAEMPDRENGYLKVKKVL
ncbi:MAG: Asp-tRNA(Asn)/Glu-tRNA(Gln) amidotransferase subunit GatC [Candidatus Pacebacteria bacterium]|jgi:aspartyl-tRNA(Asn)/glutamyl-tRNA(Gln) amidotransferase subunit C|nr:Asp-tRNA(Asn)/Glu-tRNA(Gln) amidotransferase subunit GatC [Candidatus Paceibacterota bacterium]